MTQPAEPIGPEPHPQPRPPWIRRNAPLAVGLAAGLGLVAGAVIGASAHTTTVTKIKTNTVYQTVPAASASASAPAPAQTAPTALAVGQAATLQDTSSGQAIGMVTVKSAQVTTQSADGSGNAPANGYYIVVHVSATADSSYTSGWSVSESNFYDLVNSSHYSNGNGNAFDALTSAQANSLSAQLAAGETADGWLSFDVPSRHGEIVYAPNSNGQPIAEWSY
jgi:hypothetical protein